MTREESVVIGLLIISVFIGLTISVIFNKLENINTKLDEILKSLRGR